MEVKVMKSIVGVNQEIADANRKQFEKKGIVAVNIMASPGAGKTSLILALAEKLKNKADIYVIEGDIASTIDAQKMEENGIPVIQINTGGGCHLDANMVQVAAKDLDIRDNSLLFIENVGNLVCPAAFDLGESIRLVLASTPEGHDKPYKYLGMFESADMVVINKMDVKEYVGFDNEIFYKGLRSLNEKAPVFEISCRTGKGIDELADWLKDKVDAG
ncbi:MAG: hydrogenase nickel incorporation protein HypB [Clostridiaceae bacterium]